MRAIKQLTLIRLLMILLLISVLLITGFVLFYPMDVFLDYRNKQRQEDIVSILTAVHQYRADNLGSLPNGLTTGMTERQLGTAVSGCAISTGSCSVTTSECLDLSVPLEKYLASIPFDPAATVETTGYVVSVDTNNIVTIKACGAEGTVPISVSR